MKRCPMTCGVCSKAQTIDDNAPTNQTREIAGTNNGEDTTATPCVDKKRNCKSRTKTCHKPSAKKYCRFTCNLCNRPTSTGMLLPFLVMLSNNAMHPSRYLLYLSLTTLAILFFSADNNAISMQTN